MVMNQKRRWLEVSWIFDGHKKPKTKREFTCWRWLRLKEASGLKHLESFEDNRIPKKGNPTSCKSLGFGIKKYNCTNVLEFEFKSCFPQKEERGTFFLRVASRSQLYSKSSILFENQKNKPYALHFEDEQIPK